MPQLKELISQPQWFLNSFDYHAGIFSFVEVDRKLLETAAFHDGRTNFRKNSSAPVNVAVEDILRPEVSAEVNCSSLSIVAHTSFCGSTLLSRLLEVNSNLLSYREPQVLVDLANCKAAGSSYAADRDKWGSILKFAFGQFNKCWPDQVSTAIKPSNWVNTLLPDLFGLNISCKLVVMTMSLRDYLVANIRGGRERIGYSLNLLNHLVLGNVGLSGVVAEIDGQAVSPMQRVLNLLAYCYFLQVSLIKKVVGLCAKDSCIEFNSLDFVAKPAECAVDVFGVFNVPVDTNELAEGIGRVLEVHAKNDSRVVFSHNDEQAKNAWIMEEYKKEIELACSFSFKGIVWP